MGAYILRRCGHMVVLLAIISLLNFVVIELPPGSYLDTLHAQLQAEKMGEQQIQGILESVNARFGLDRPWYVRYGRWITGLARGDLGYSLALRQSANDLVRQRLALSIVISLSSLLFALVLAIAIGSISAVWQYSWADYLLTFLGYIGLAVPDFLLALVLMFVAVMVLHMSSIGGLFSTQYVAVPWSGAKVMDLLRHLWLPVIIVGTSGTAATARIVRARLLDTLGEPFVQTARMKGLSEYRVITRHALRPVMNPVVSRLGLALPHLISGEALTAVVLSLPTIGPLLLQALLVQDMYLAGSILMLLTVALLVGNLLADIALAWLDPRIRLE